MGKLRLGAAVMAAVAGLGVLSGSSALGATGQGHAHDSASCGGYGVLLDHSDGAVSLETPSGCSAPAFLGSMAGKHLNAPIVGMATVPGGGGYWLVGADGGIFTFGNAKYYGSTGALKLNKPVVGMAADGATGGYWLVASDGGVFAFHAPFLGSMGGVRLNAPVKFITGTPDFGGYRMVGADGGVFDFGDATYYGSAAGASFAVWEALATTADGNGYWLFSNSLSGSTVTVAAYGDASTNLVPNGGDSDSSPIVGAAGYSGSASSNGAPAVTTDPVSQNVDAGSTATFTAAATNYVSVQWEQSTDGGATFSALSGGSSPTISFTAQLSQDGDQLRAVFTNAVGSTTTSAATLYVSPTAIPFRHRPAGIWLRSHVRPPRTA